MSSVVPRIYMDPLDIVESAYPETNNYYSNMNSNNIGLSCINNTTFMDDNTPSVWTRLSRVIYSIFDWNKNKTEFTHPANGNDNNV